MRLRQAKQLKLGVNMINVELLTHLCKTRVLSSPCCFLRFNDICCSETAIQRGKQAVDLLYDLRRGIPQFLESDSTTAFGKQAFLLLISSTASHVTNASREIRHAALINLQRLLLGPQPDLDEAQVEGIFNRVLFALASDLLNPRIFHLDPRGMPETRLRVSALLCKAFMHFEVNDAAKQKDIVLLWIQLLDVLDKLMHADKRDQLVSIFMWIASKGLNMRLTFLVLSSSMRLFQNHSKTWSS